MVVSVRIATIDRFRLNCVGISMATRHKTRVIVNYELNFRANWRNSEGFSLKVW